MPVFLAQSQIDPETRKGKLYLGSTHNRARFQDFLTSNPGVRLRIEPMTPESRKQRAFYHGGVITLWAYLDGNDYRESSILEKYHDYAKVEFNGEMLKIDGCMRKVGQSTKGKLNQGYIDRIIDHLEENYGIDRVKVLDPERYKYFRDVVFMEGKYDTYIDYLKELKLLS